MAAVRVILAGAMLLTTTRAAAHEPAKAVHLVWPDAQAPEPSVLVTNRGLVFSDGDGLALRCAESYGASTASEVSVFVEDQTLLLGLYSGAYQTTDRGCSMSEGSGLPDVSLGTIASVSDALLAPTRSLDEPAGVWASEDLGLTWSERHTNEAGQYFDRLVVSPSNPDRVYAVGVRQTATMLASTCGVSDDNGRTWTVHDVDSGVKPFAVHPGAPDTVFAVQLVDSRNTSYDILRSTDACETFSVVMEDVGEPSGLTGSGDDSTLWLGLAAGNDAGGLYVSEDDGASFSEVLAEELNFVSCVVQRGERLWVCANRPPNKNGVWFSDDGAATLQPFMTMADVPRPVTCEQAEARAECAMPWYDFYSELHPDGGGSADAGTSDASTGDAGTSPEAGVVTDSGVSEPSPEAGVPGNEPPDPEPALDAGDGPKVGKSGSGGCQLSRGDVPQPQATSLWLLALLSGWGLCRRLRRTRVTPRRTSSDRGAPAGR